MPTPLTIFTVIFLCFRRGQLVPGDKQSLDHRIGQQQIRQAALGVIHNPLYSRPARIFTCPDPASIQSTVFFLGEVINHGRPTIDEEQPTLDLGSLSEFEQRHIYGLESKDDHLGAKNQITTKELITTFPLCRELRGRLTAFMLTITKQLVEEAQDSLEAKKTLRELSARERTKCVLLFGPSPFVDLGGPSPETISKLLPGAGVAYTCVMETFTEDGRVWKHRYRITKAEHLPLR